MNVLQKFMNIFSIKENVLVIFTLAAVVCGILFGLILKFNIELTDREIYLISFPGEIFMNILRMLIIPLIVSSLISGLSELDSKCGGKMGIYIIIYYATTTLLAIFTGIILIICIHPGNSSIKIIQQSSLSQKEMNINSLDAFLDIIRNMIPSNMVETFFKQAVTNYKKFTRKYNKNNDTIYENISVIEINSRESTNILGLVTISISFGLILGQMGVKARVMVRFFDVIAEVTMKLICLVMWYSPIGIFFIIVSRVLEIDNLKDTVSALGLFLLTVYLGLVIHTTVTLNILYFICTKKNSLKYFRGMIRAWATAFGTDSSSATLPITFECLEKNNGIDKRVTRFVLPIGATINMDGTALYEAVAAIFIAQINGLTLSFGQMLFMSLTATLTAIGGSSIPNAGLITMILVLHSVGLPIDDVSLVITLDWIIDRSRTSTNVIGDAFGAGIIDHFCRDQLRPSMI